MYFPSEDRKEYFFRGGVGGGGGGQKVGKSMKNRDKAGFLKLNFGTHPVNVAINCF